MTRSVFYGFRAFVGALTGPTSCGFWPDDPNAFRWAAGSLVHVDLARNPQAVHAGKITPADIQVDDYIGHRSGGLTSIGPMWPGGTTVGACWVESTHWATLAGKGHQPPRAHARAYDYELTSVLYWDGPLKGRRFRGVHAHVHAMNGALADVEMWHPGDHASGAPSIARHWLDLGAHHPVEPGFTAVSAAGHSGALFVDSYAIGTIVAEPKKPWYLGGSPKRGRRAVSR